MVDIKWPKRPKPLHRADGVDWWITFTERSDGSLVLDCNGTKFCVLRPSKYTKGQYLAPGRTEAMPKLAAMQTAATMYLGDGALACTLVSA